MRRAALVATSALAAASWGAAAVAAPALPAVLTFSAGYQTGGDKPGNVVELGVVYRCGSGTCMDTRRFDSARLLPRSFTPYRHRMQAPYRRPDCRDGQVGVVEPDRRDHEEVRLVEEENGFAVVTPTARYRWIADSAVADGYSLSAVVRHEQGVPLQQVVGFAFQSARVSTGDLDRSQLAPRYRGEIHLKTAEMGALQPWRHRSSTMNFRLFDAAADGPLLHLSQPGTAAVVQKYGKQMWVHHTVVLARSDDPVAPVLHEYGHDFDMDGCFNEQGHNKFMLPVADPAGQVSAFVYVEYTSDLRRGFPMLSVGRYYR